MVKYLKLDDMTIEVGLNYTAVYDSTTSSVVVSTNSGETLLRFIVSSDSEGSELQSKLQTFFYDSDTVTYYLEPKS